MYIYVDQHSNWPDPRILTVHFCWLITFWGRHPVLFSFSVSFLLPCAFCYHVPVLAIVSFSLFLFLVLSFCFFYVSCIMLFFGLYLYVSCAFIFFLFPFLCSFFLSASMSCSLPCVSCSFFLFLVLSFCWSFL